MTPDLNIPRPKPLTEAQAAAVNRAISEAFGRKTPRRAVTSRRIEAALDTLGDLMGEDHPEFEDGALRDDVSRVRDALDRLVMRRAGER